MADAAAIPHGGGARPGAFAIWIQAIRAPSLSAAAIPVLLGSRGGGARGIFLGWRACCSRSSARWRSRPAPISSTTTTIFVAARTSPQSLGPSMVIQRGLLSAEQVWRGGIVAFAIGAALGLCAGVPVRMADSRDRNAQHRGGILLHREPGVARVRRARRADGVHLHGPGDRARRVLRDGAGVFRSALWASVPLGFLVAGILHANNIRDIESDGCIGKHTLATILGRVARSMN